MQGTAPTAEQLTDELLGFLAYLNKATQSGVFREAGELELTLTQLRVLFLLAHADAPPALSRVAEQIALSVAATGRAVDALVRGGIVSRREDPDDRRIKRLALTDQGEAMLERMAEARRDGLRQFVDLLDEDARAQFSRALNLIPAACGCHPIGDH